VFLLQAKLDAGSVCGSPIQAERSAIAAAHTKFFGLQNKVDWDAIPFIMIPLLGVLYEAKKGRCTWRPRPPVSLAVRDLVPPDNCLPDFHDSR
jgi:hypothetical protein